LPWPAVARLLAAHILPEVNTGQRAGVQRTSRADGPVRVDAGASGGRCMENGSKPLRDALRQCWVYSTLRVTRESGSSIVHVLKNIPALVVRRAVEGAMGAGR
jgi:hypothetical protein